MQIRSFSGRNEASWSSSWSTVRLKKWRTGISRNCRQLGTYERNEGREVFGSRPVAFASSVQMAQLKLQPDQPTPESLSQLSSALLVQYSTVLPVFLSPGKAPSDSGGYPWGYQDHRFHKLLVSRRLTRQAQAASVTQPMFYSLPV